MNRRLHATGRHSVSCGGRVMGDSVQCGFSDIDRLFALHAVASVT